jgi:hypothetical protein
MDPATYSYSAILCPSFKASVEARTAVDNAQHNSSMDQAAICNHITENLGTPKTEVQFPLQLLVVAAQ